MENAVPLSIPIFANTQPFEIGKGFPQTHQSGIVWRR